MSDNKYKMFRNYMCNELGISKEDIKEWTKGTIAEQVQKLMGQMNFEQMVIDNTKRMLYGNYNQIDEIKKNIATELAKNINISLLK